MRRFFAFLSLSLLLTGLAFGQAAAGVAGISGVVQDPTTAGVPNAKVIIASEGQGTLRTLITNAEGIFNAPALTPGPGYSITVTAEGFANYEAKNLTLQVGQNLDLHISLAVGQTTTSVEVTAAATLVDDTKTDMSSVVDTRSIQDLPINGRRVDNFVLLTPGVTNDGNFGLLSFRGVANGNTFLLDGNDSTEEFFVENNGRTRIISQISQDAVQEFQVVSANFSAEYGRANGGVVNTVTRSGSNQVHGTGYWFWRNQDFEAHDPYASVNPPESRTQAGASIGGAFIKDKLFYFFNGDFTRRNEPLVDSLVRPGVIDSVNQKWIGCGTGSTPASPAQCAAIDALLPRFYGTFPRTLDQDLGFGRLDYHLSERNSLTASLNFMHFKTPNGLQQTLATSTTGAAINGNGNDYGRVRNGDFSWTSIASPRLVNQFRFGWMTDLEGDDANMSLLGSLGLLDVSIAGQQIGPINYLPRVEPREQRFEFGDNATWNKGTHLVKFGADVATTADYSYFIFNHNGSYSYSTVNAFALDFSGNTTGAKNWQSYTQAYGDPTVDASINDYGFYVEDQWRVNNRLTVNYGLRYEYAQLPQPTSCNPDYPQTCHIHSPSNDLMPRIGVAYRLNDKTVLRAGYGMFYARVAGASIQDMFTNNAFTTRTYGLSRTQAPQLAAGPVFPNILPAVPSVPNLSALSLQVAAPNWKVPYSEQGTFSLERQLSHDTAISASYVWSRGVQLYGIRDLNLPPLSSTNFTYTIADAGGNPVGSYTTPIYLGTRPDPRYSGIYQDENGVTSSYNALAVQVTKAFSHGLQGNLAYTWSHEIDDGQSYGQSTSNLFLSNNFNWLYNGNYKADKGNGNEDQRQRFVLSWVWEPTFTHRTGSFYKYFVNNWQLSSITTLGSARPYGSPSIRTTDTPVPGMLSNFTINGSGMSSRVPFLPVNNVYQPAFYRADARLSKLIPINERFKLYLNWEVFNLSNSWSPTSMLTQEYVESKGVLTLTPGAYNVGSGDAMSPDGTEARRMQVSARVTF